MIAGIRLGETFVGIQPARGFHLDLAANYHDPDLVPPHSYLAFYFWLRRHYRVDAVIHLGKHGNLEWLPGKGTGLAATCWPDIALGPLPHFYPFIVNDPGEGAQAKRRAQAVIIDHLMPPMTRAETYGELATLENLVDEYYQALGMDERRETWLRGEILRQAADNRVIDELGLTSSTEEDEVLSRLDTWLCDIKEAQIRNGLHVLGQLPSISKQADTLVALLRLPRGDAPEARGILHCLVTDLGLAVDGDDFDPLADGSSAWIGERPQILEEVSDDAWRSDADTRERLELLAARLVASYLLGDGDIDGLDLPATRTLLAHARDTIVPALAQSADKEISALVEGLGGAFVEPGPSGAPTRGRLDTLPTGRNFFAVDNRSIPSPAAWVLGQRSAQALIERHLQEQGDYPRQVGLSVWGTATMRTGGDDIAQAFAQISGRYVVLTQRQRLVERCDRGGCSVGHVGENDAALEVDRCVVGLDAFGVDKCAQRGVEILRVALDHRPQQMPRHLVRGLRRLERCDDLACGVDLVVAQVRFGQAEREVDVVGLRVVSPAVVVGRAREVAAREVQVGDAARRASRGRVLGFDGLTQSGDGVIVAARSNEVVGQHEPFEIGHLVAEAVDVVLNERGTRVDIAREPFDGGGSGDVLNGGVVLCEHARHQLVGLVGFARAGEIDGERGHVARVVRVGRREFGTQLHRAVGVAVLRLVREILVDHVPLPAECGGVDGLAQHRQRFVVLLEPIEGGGHAQQGGH